MNQVQLIDGRMVSADSEDWRHECEARSIAKLPTTELRRAWIEAIAHKRGPAEANRLKDTIKAMWEQK